MNVLIVENDARLGEVWCDHIGRFGVCPSLVTNQSDAVEELREQSFDVLILNLNLHFGSAMAVADYASYRRPDMKVIFVSSDSFFSDGSIFNYMSNACAMVPRAMPPEDLAALVDYHAR
jgi:DNA-binding response OmpR family regulator